MEISRSFSIIYDFNHSATFFGYFFGTVMKVLGSLLYLKVHYHCITIA